MTNKPRWAKLQTSDINRIQGIYKTETQNIGTVSLSCWWPCFWIWVMQSYWILLSYYLCTLTGETFYYLTTSVHWQVRHFTILLTQYTDMWLFTTILPQWPKGETLYYLTNSVHWLLRPFSTLLPQYTDKRLCTIVLPQCPGHTVFFVRSACTVAPMLCQPVHW